MFQLHIIQIGLTKKSFRKQIIYSRIKSISFLVFTLFSLFFYSCGLLDAGNDHNPVRLVTVNKIYSIDTSGSNIKFLTYGNKPQFSPDGNKIYFGNMNTINIDGTGLQRLIPQDLSVWDFSFSNDYKKIVFSTFYELYIMNTDGSNLVKLIPKDTSWDFYTNARFSPNDSMIAFQSNFQISIINSNASNRKILLYSDSANHFYNPVFSNDGSKLFFIRRNYFNEYSIYQYNFKTTGYSSIYSAQPTNGLEVSPDGYLIFSSNNIIQEFNLTTGIATNLTDGCNENFNKLLNKIVYNKINDPDKAIYIYDIQTADITKIKSGLPWASIQYSSLSPKGNIIIFEADSSYFVPY